MLHYYYYYNKKIKLQQFYFLLLGLFCVSSDGLNKIEELKVN